MAVVRSAALACLVGCLVLAGNTEAARILNNMGPEPLIATEGYPVQTHTVKTSDGYFLKLHRIPNPGKPVVFLQHGLMSSSADWVILGRDKSLAYILHDNGYDVWMGNARGNTYSRKHEKFSERSSDFWDFSWHQIGNIDVPSSIDYALNNTGQRDLFYVGHSQGTTAFFVMTSTRPEYNAKIKAAFALAPIAFMETVRALPFKLMAKWSNQLGLMSRMIGVNEFFPNTKLLASLSGALCKDNTLTQLMCTNTLFLFTGFDSDQMNTTMLPLISQYTPAGSSVKQFVHYGQLITGKKFRQFDHGFIRNQRIYGMHPPPEYDLSAVTAPVYLHYSDNDLCGTPEGSRELAMRLPNVRVNKRVPHAKFNHMDFLYAKDGVELLYNDLLAEMAEVNQITKVPDVLTEMATVADVTEMARVADVAEKAKN